MSASEIPKDKTLKFALVTDLDHTLVNHKTDGEHRDLLSFNKTWQTFFLDDSLLVYSTGRSPVMYSQLRNSAPMITPDVLICSVGTQIFWRLPDGTFKPDQSWTEKLDQGWDAKAIKETVASFNPGPLTQQNEVVMSQTESEQRRHKISYHLQAKSEEEKESLIQALRNRLAEKGIKAQVLFSGGKDLDVLPIEAGKGRALAYLLEELKSYGRFPSEGVQVNGDSGNDIDLFKVEGVKGCVVSNAMEELVQWAKQQDRSDSIFMATEECSRGIVEALNHFGTFQKRTKNDISNFVLATIDLVASNKESNGFLGETFYVETTDGKVVVGSEDPILRNRLNMEEDSIIFVDSMFIQLGDGSSVTVNFHLCRISGPEGEKTRTINPITLYLSKSGGSFQWAGLKVGELFCDTDRIMY